MILKISILLTFGNTMISLKNGAKFQFSLYFQPYEDVYITIDDQDFNIVNRLINAIYFGQATVTSSDRKELESLLSLLKVKIDLTADSSESSEEEESKNKANGEKIILKLSCSECTMLQKLSKCEVKALLC